MTTTTAPALNRSTSPDLHPDVVAGYHEQGYVLVDGLFNDDEIEAMRHDATAICRGERGEYNGWVGPHDGQSDDEVLKQYLCIHFPHKISQTMLDGAKDPRIARVLTQIIGPNVKCMQSMLFIKAAGKPGQAWHQDEFYIPTRDRSLTGAWIALDDATIENGCLWVLPGSQRRGVLWPQHQQNDPRFDCAGESCDFPYTDDDAVPVEVKKGGVLFFNGYLLHRSLPNTAKTGYRRVLVNHYMSAESFLPWRLPEGQTNVGMGTLDFRDILMVAGKDPYAYKGVDDLVRPHVRPSGEGGCQDWKKKRKKTD